jgi:hypothetical protein
MPKSLEISFVAKKIKSFEIQNPADTIQKSKLFDYSVVN